MTELTTDQSAAGALLPFLHQLQYTGDLYETNSGDTAVGKVNRTLADGTKAVGLRLGEVAEALAAGTLRIIDEGELVHQIAHLIAADDPDWEKHIGSAQNLVLKIWKSTGVLR